MLISCVLDPAARPHVGDAFMLSGRLDMDALQRALSEVVDRHEILRTVFPTSGYRIDAHVLATTAVHIPQIDLEHLRRTEQQAEVRRHVQSTRLEKFDFCRVPPWRVLLLRLTSSTHVFVIVLHELICDGLSFEVVMHEIAGLYSAACTGEDSQLDDRPLQYFDVVRELGLDRKLQRDYWTRDRTARPLAMSYPFESGGFSMGTRNYASETIKLPDELAARLRALGESEAATAVMVYLAVFFLLMYKCAYGAELLIDIPVSGRTHTAFEDVIGFFARRIPLHVPLRGEQSFRTALGRVRELVLEIVAVAEQIPYPEPLSAVPGIRGLDNSMVSFRHYGGAHDRPLRFAGMKVKRILSQQDQGHLSMVVSERQQTSVRLESDTLGSAVVKDLLVRYRSLLVEVAEHPDRQVRELAPPAGAARQQPVAGRPGSGARKEGPEHCLHELVEMQARRTPDATAARSAEEEVSYRELDSRANRLARALHEQGVSCSTSVGIRIAPSLDLVVAMLGVWKAGGTCLLMEGDDTRALDDESLETDVIVASHLAAPVARAGQRIVDIDDVPVLEHGERSTQSTGLDSAALIIRTAGVTDRAKSVVLTQRTLADLTHWWRHVHRLQESDRAFHVHGPGAQTWALAPWPYLVSGAEIICPAGFPAQGGARMSEWLQARPITIATLPAELAASLLAAGRAAAPSLRTVVAYGRGSLARRADVAVFRAYALAEAGGVAMLARARDAIDAHLIGHPDTARVKAYVLDADLALVPPGGVGELCLGGTGLARGYLDRPDATAAAFVQDPFAAEPGARMVKTGDLARRGADGSIELIGRTQDEVRFRGFRLNAKLAQLEAALGSNPAVAAAAACWDDAGASLAAYLVPTHRDPPSARDLDRWVKRTMAEWILPACYVAVEEIPLRPDGSVDRLALARMPGRSVDSGGEPGTPLAGAEQKLASIWGKVLKRRRVEPGENFFRIGGDLVLAVEMVSRAEQAGVPVTLGSLMEGPTIAELAATLEDAR
jgi:non-ribosomal peptide synthetase component F/aryl carrier-like protein